jgi:hypothetical protein
MIAVVAAAVCYGVASVLQAVGARATAATTNVDPRLLIRVLRQTPFLVGSLLDLAGFVLQFLALRRLPIFVVQSCEAGNLAVTAMVAVPVLGATMIARQWVAVLAVVAGLGLLAVSAGTDAADPTSMAFRFGLLAVAVLLVPVGLAAGRLAEPVRSIVLGLVAGLGFGVTALAIRAMSSLAPMDLIRDPATWALVVGGLSGFLFFTTGLQHGSVTTLSAAVVVTETTVPALVGVLVLGDGTRPGFVPMAAVGFGLAVLGALVLAWFTEPVDSPPTAAPAGDRLTA